MHTWHIFVTGKRTDFGSKFSVFSNVDQTKTVSSIEWRHTIDQQFELLPRDDWGVLVDRGARDREDTEAVSILLQYYMGRYYSSVSYQNQYSYTTSQYTGDVLVLGSWYTY